MKIFLIRQIIFLSCLVVVGGALAGMAMKAHAGPIMNEEDQTYYRQTPEQIDFIVKYKSQEQWVVEHFFVRPARLQEKASQQIFQTQTEADIYIIKNFKGVQRLDEKSLHDLSLREGSLTTTEVRSKVIWEVKHQWNLEWEERYVTWVESNFNQDFFVKYKIATDCADVAYSLRWIFARIHGLPAAGTLAGSRVLFTNESFRAEWAPLETHAEWHKDRLFLAALNYLNKNVYTGTLGLDTYPLRLTKDSFRVGTIHLMGGHTMIISEILDGVDSAPIWKLSSTVPQQVRQLHREMMIEAQHTDAEHGGYLQFRWPQKINQRWELVKKEEMPLYSLEQYDSKTYQEKGHFTLFLIEKLELSFNPQKILETAFDSVVKAIYERVSVVSLGKEYCLARPCSPGTEGYENYSTPSRDARLEKHFKDIEILVSELSAFDQTLWAKHSNFLSKTKINIEPGQKTLGQIKYDLSNKYLSYDPRDSHEERWATNNSAIESTLVKRHKMFLDVRAEAIKRAEVCRGSGLCNRGQSQWGIHNTFDLDAKIYNEVYISYLSLCRSERSKSCSIPDTNFALILKIPFYVSEPDATIEERQGQSIEKATILDSGFVAPLNRDLLFVNKGIYSVAEKKFIISLNNFLHQWATIDQLNGQLLVSKSQQKVYYIHDGYIKSYDWLKKSQQQYPLPHFRFRMKWLTPEMILATDCQVQTASINIQQSEREACEVFLIRSSSEKIDVVKSFQAVSVVAKFEGAYFEDNYSAARIESSEGEERIFYFVVDENQRIDASELDWLWAQQGDTLLIVQPDENSSYEALRFTQYVGSQKSCFYVERGSAQPMDFRSRKFYVQQGNSHKIIEIQADCSTKTTLQFSAVSYIIPYRLGPYIGLFDYLNSTYYFLGSNDSIVKLKLGREQNLLGLHQNSLVTLVLQEDGKQQAFEYDLVTGQKKQINSSDIRLGCATTSNCYGANIIQSLLYDFEAKTTRHTVYLNNSVLLSQSKPHSPNRTEIGSGATSGFFGIERLEGHSILQIAPQQWAVFAD